MPESIFEIERRLYNHTRQQSIDGIIIILGPAKSFEIVRSYSDEQLRSFLVDLIYKMRG